SPACCRAPTPRRWRRPPDVDGGAGTVRPRVLCVDDEPHVLRALVWLLGGRFDVCTATSAVDALSLVQKNDYDVVISDQRMPGITGVEFLRDVRRHAPRAMRILLTGYSDLDAMERSANESEVFRFIAKPWSVQELVAVVGEAADIAQQTSVAAVEAPPEAADRRKREILVFDSAESAKLVAEELGELAQVHAAVDYAQALEALATHPIAILVSEMQVGEVEATRLIRAAKERHPAIVSVVFSATRDAQHLMALVNQGQVFRLIPKPAKPGFVRLVVETALRRHRELERHPGLIDRYRGAVSAAAKEALEHDLGVMARAAAAHEAKAKESRSGVIRWLLGK
ncbi:MAG TPA: response regulator, partial [Burkholderiales bacterium]